VTATAALPVSRTAHPHPERSPFARLLIILGVAIAYYVAGRLGLAAASVDRNIALVWPATGLALALLMRVGTYTWPGIVLGDLTVAIQGHVQPTVALGIAVGHALGPLAAVSILRRAGVRQDLSQPRDALWLAGASLLGMALPATLGVTSLLLGRLLPVAAAAPSWMRWWVGDLVGTIAVAPAVLTFSLSRLRAARGSRLAEFTALMATTLAAGFVAWTSQSPLPVAFLSLPPLAWAVLRFGVTGSSAVTLVLAAFAAWATANQLGPLAAYDVQTRLLMLAAFLATMAVAHLLGATLLRARLEAEEQLDRERLLVGTVVDSVNDGIVAVDAGGRIVVFNAAAERLVGRRKAAALGQPVDAVLPSALGTGAASLVAPDGARMAGSAAATAEVESVRSDGSTFPLEVSVTRVAHGGQILTTAVLRDLSGHKRAERERAALEAELRQSQKMEAIGTLAGGVAHDFNNILGAILGNAELLRLDLAAEHPGHDSIGQIVKASKRARALVNQILTFSRQGEGTRQIVSLEQVAQEAAALIRPSLPDSVQLVIHGDPRCPKVVADPSQILQVILNLCTNALHAMRQDGGTLEIRVEPAEGDLAMVLVRDTGVGMSPDVRDRIFEPFFTTRPTGEGTGLGLSVVHGIVRSHHGSIEVESSPGNGSTFRVFLPGTGLQLPSALPAETPVRTGRGERVLFVDDEAPLVSLGVRTLRRLGYNAEGCRDPEEALAILRARPTAFQLLVTDLSMPGWLGTDLIAEARTVCPGIATVLVTGYGGSLATGQLELLGIRHVMSKPATLQTFGRVVRDALDDRERGSVTGQPSAAR
jgi:PAS domain S-box-containing protein